MLPWVDQRRLVCTKPTPLHTELKGGTAVNLHLQTHIFNGATRRENESEDRN